VNVKPHFGFVFILTYRNNTIYNTPMAKKCLLPLQNLEEAALCLKTLAHPHRLRMIQMLLDGEYTVGELAEACEIPSHMASEHLGKMKDRGFLTSKKEGRSTYYSISERSLESILGCIEKRFG
ncbi:MAG: winged helix-turn-helix transcriptional regulator, partial [Bdellovibrionales bacterium]|nr:winged helix-turn-helix transcriptional regulator [Bdellovibrionales bacterium]